MSANIIISLVMGWGLIIGTICSYIPQYIKLIRRGNTEGISHVMILLGVLSGFLNFLGSLQSDLEEIRHCGNDSIMCAYHITPLIQISAPGVCLLLLYGVFIHFLRREQRFNNWPEAIPIMSHHFPMIIPPMIIPPIQTNHPIPSMVSDESRILLDNDARSARTRVKSCKIYWYYSIMTVIIVITVSSMISIILNVADGKVNLSAYSLTINIIAGLLSCLMWIPQIIVSVRTREAKSLSLWSLGIHSVGCLIAVIYQAVISSQSYWNIVSFAVSGILELVIIIICLIRNDRFKRCACLKERKIVSVV